MYKYINIIDAIKIFILIITDIYTQVLSTRIVFDYILQYDSNSSVL